MKYIAINKTNPSIQFEVTEDKKVELEDFILTKNKYRFQEIVKPVSGVKLNELDEVKSKKNKVAKSKLKKDDLTEIDLSGNTK